MSLFEELPWRDPIGGQPLSLRVTAYRPEGSPLSGALLVEPGDEGFPIVDCVARMTPESAAAHTRWLEAAGIRPRGGEVPFQAGATVDSFGFQWSWSSEMRTERDLEWRTARRFGLEPDFFSGKLVLDAGCGAGDQSRWMLSRGSSVVSVDLSAAIDVAARKLSSDPSWAGVQGDLARLPFRDGAFDVVYCEGVIQHTADSAATAAELVRMLKPGGVLLATHYIRSSRPAGRLRERWQEFIRLRLSRLDRPSLQFASGLLALGAHTPGLRAIFRKSGTALYSELMPEFAKTWVNTFDYYGSHSFQRLIDPRTFSSYFEGGETRIAEPGPGIVLVERTKPRT